METALRKTALKKANKKGFTLVELVIVIAVLAILAAIAVPTVTNIIDTANKNTDAANCQTIELALKSASAEVAANTWKDGDGTVGNALTHEGLNFDTMDKNIKSGGHFYYGIGTNNKGKVYTAIAADTTAETKTDLLEAKTTLSDFIDGNATTD